VPDFGVVSYAFAALSFLILTLLLSAGWEGRPLGLRFIAACAATCAWGVLHAYVVLMDGTAAVALVVLAELLRYGGWLLLLTGAARMMGLRPVWLRGLEWLLLAILVLALGGVVAGGEWLEAVASRWLLAGTLLCLATLVLLEQLYRNATDRRALTYIAIGLATLLTYDLFVYVQAYVVGGVVTSSWQARGLITGAAAPMIAIAARRHPDWALNVFLSRQIVFYSTTLVGIGGFLLFVALGGELVASYGGTWGRAVQIAAVAIASMAVAYVLASPDTRRQWRVFLAKHFHKTRYDYRAEWLRFIETLSLAKWVPGSADPTAPAAAGETGVPDPYVRAIRAIAQIVGSPAGALYLRRDGNPDAYQRVAVWPDDAAARSGPPAIPARHSLIRFFERSQWVVDLDEHRLRPELYAELSLAEGFDTPESHRLLLPLFEGRNLLGFVTLVSPPPPFEPNFEDRDLLKTVGRHVATHIAQHEADRGLAESRQFEAYHRLTAFVMHDLKNLAAQLSLLVANAERHKRNPEFVDDAISTVANSARRMERLIAQLQGREERGLRRRVTASTIAAMACERCSLRQPLPRLQVGVDPMLDVDPERLAGALEHLVRNAQEATPQGGEVAVEVDATDGEAIIRVADTGCGMSERFVQTRLFAPFDTTKGSKGMGIGAYQAREYVLGIGGTLNVRTAPGGGSVFEIRLKTG
jgi:putative PEP-CTERM system histidine kinase